MPDSFAPVLLHLVFLPKRSFVRSVQWRGFYNRRGSVLNALLLQHVMCHPPASLIFWVVPIASSGPGAERFRFLQQMSQRFLSKVYDDGSSHLNLCWRCPLTCQEMRCWLGTEGRIWHHPLCGTGWICLAVMNSGRILGFGKDWSTCCLPFWSVAAAAAVTWSPVGHEGNWGGDIICQGSPTRCQKSLLT